MFSSASWLKVPFNVPGESDSEIVDTLHNFIIPVEAKLVRS